jgi:hypothetical protein
MAFVVNVRKLLLTHEPGPPQPHFPIAFTPGTRVLDVGCGSGRDLQALIDAGYAAAVDASDEMLREATRRYPALATSLSCDTLPNLPSVLDASYDGIVCPRRSRLTQPRRNRSHPEYHELQLSKPSSLWPCPSLGLVALPYRCCIPVAAVNTLSASAFGRTTVAWAPQLRTHGSISSRLSR